MNEFKKIPFKTRQLSAQEMREVNIDNCTSKGPNHKKEDDSFKIEIKNFLNLIFDAMTRMI